MVKGGLFTNSTSASENDRLNAKDSPSNNAQTLMVMQKTAFYALGAIPCSANVVDNSPASYISRMMSHPPRNSPLT